MLTRVFLIVLGLAVIGVSSATQQFAAAQTKNGMNQSEASPIQKAELESSAEGPKLSGRLPRYYSSVVRPEQRQAIYQIQATYRQEIAKLQMQLEELKQRESEEIAQVLSEEQRDRVMQLQNAGATSSSPTAASMKESAAEPTSEPAKP